MIRTHLFQGIKDKVEVAQNLCDQLGITLKEVAYIGDDINDIKLLKRVGIAGSPANAPEYVSKYASIITTKSGGDGAFREFVETILSQNNLLEEAIEKYLKGQKSIEQ